MHEPASHRCQSPWPAFVLLAAVVTAGGSTAAPPSRPFSRAKAEALLHLARAGLTGEGEVGTIRVSRLHRDMSSYRPYRRQLSISFGGPLTPGVKIIILTTLGVFSSPGSA